MKRADLEKLKAEMSTRYAEQLLTEQTHLTIDQRAHMCMGFEHGMGWLWKILEKAGLSLEEEAGPSRPRVCIRCRQVFDGGVGRVRCPHCMHAQEVS